MSKKELIVITGGAGGIGQACARTFKNQPIIITDYAQDAVDEVVDELAKEGYDASGISCDITDKADIKKLTEFVKEQGSFKSLIHTAGVSGTAKDLELIYNVDLVATEYLLEAFEDLAEEESSAILMASMMAHTVPANEKYDEALNNPQDESSLETIKKYIDDNPNTLYNFVKRGVLLLTKKYAPRWGEKGARVVSVAPGIIETPMAMKAQEEYADSMEKMKAATPLKRNGKPEDIADVVNFLTSDSARFITGTDILVDGGVLPSVRKMIEQYQSNS